MIKRPSQCPPHRFIRSFTRLESIQFDNHLFDHFRVVIDIDGIIGNPAEGINGKYCLGLFLG
jgi:hypothetical protein